MWSPAARLTFAAYLIHPIIMTTVYLSSRSALAWDPYFVAVQFSGFVMMSYGAALILWLLVEKPLQNLEKMFIISFPKNKEKVKSDKPQLAFKQV